MPLILGFSLALSGALTSGNAFADLAAAQQMPQAQTVKEYVQTYFVDAPIMVAIAQCESHFHQYDADGSVYRGVVNDRDVGVMQVNEFYHADVAKKLGINLHTLQGNVSYARYLYEKQGTAPWVSSSPCWSKTKAAKELAMANKAAAN